MVEISDSSREDVGAPHSGEGVSATEVMVWFAREVLPMEPILMHFLRSNRRNKDDIDDLRQDVYLRVCEAAQKKFPDQVKPFVLATARNLLIDRARRERVVPIEAIADTDTMGIALDAPSPERAVIARDELRRLQAAIDDLPPRCREAIILGRVEGLSGREIAARMGISEMTASEHLSKGIYALTETLHGEGRFSGGKR
jgi:RNA polymerase sigma-70 factor (ECF subfamily)